jgi:hypothetical protein
MRQAYAHDAVLVLPPGAGARGPGEAVTTALRGCGPYDLAATGDGDRLRLRILFAVAPGQVDGVRERIDAALAAGEWELVRSGCARIAAADRGPARLLLRSGRSAGE